MKLRIRQLLFMSLVAVVPAWAVDAESRIQFDPVDDEEVLQRLVVKIIGSQNSTAVVTDIHFDIVSWEGDALEVFTAANQAKRDPFQWDFYAAFSVVAGGKLYREGGGMCSPWKDNLSICTVECDGGHFQLRRDLGETFHRVSVILSPIPEIIENDQSAAFRIGGCSGEEDEVLLDVGSGRQEIVTFSRWAQ